MARDLRTRVDSELEVMVREAIRQVAKASRRALD